MGMTQPSEPTRTATPWLRLSIGGSVAALMGFYGSTFGPFYIAVIGAIVLIIGLSQALRRAKSGKTMVLVGVGLLIGAAAYTALGVFGSSDPPSQSGCVMSTGEPCATN